jgi:hypothetical protein
MDRWPPLLSLLVLGALLLAIGAGVWAHRGDWAMERRDLERERESRVRAGEIYSYAKESGRLPAFLARQSSSDSVADAPMDYRVVDAHRFEIGVNFEGAQARHGVLGFFDGPAHPRGLVWYSFDVRGHAIWPGRTPTRVEAPTPTGLR